MEQQNTPSPSGAYQVGGETTREQINIWKRKAEKWDELAEKIAKYYPEEGEDEDFDDSDGLIGIGEAAAIAFGYL